MMALEEAQDDDSVVETLLELGASVAFKNKVGVVMEGLLWHPYIIRYIYGRVKGSQCNLMGIQCIYIYMMW